jgi:hypothetical protein
MVQGLIIYCGELLHVDYYSSAALVVAECIVLGVP